MVNMQMHSGALCHMEMNFAADDHSSDSWSFYVKVIGTRGATRYSYNDWVVNSPAAVHSHSYEPYPHTILETDRHFIQQVMAKGEPPLSSLQDAITCQRIIEAAETSADNGIHVTL